MQKTKTNTYLLLFAVAVVWGVIIYKLLFSIHTTEHNSKNIEQFTSSNIIKIDSVQKFAIKANYRDPFLGRINHPIKKKTIIKKAIIKPKVVFPKIEYSGVISSGNSNKFIIKINREQFFFNINDIFQEIQLLSGDKTQITVLYQSESRTYLFK